MPFWLTYLLRAGTVILYECHILLDPRLAICILTWQQCERIKAYVLSWYLLCYIKTPNRA